MLVKFCINLVYYVFMWVPYYPIQERFSIVSWLFFNGLTALFMVFSVMHNSVTCPNLRCILGYIND